jgi:hypothetical protein
MLPANAFLVVIGIVVSRLTHLMSQRFYVRSRVDQPLEVAYEPLKVLVEKGSVVRLLLLGRNS